jgi:hypothetical protein
MRAEKIPQEQYHVQLTLDYGEAECLWFIANWENLVSETFRKEVLSSSNYKIKECIHSLYAALNPIIKRGT